MSRSVNSATGQSTGGGGGGNNNDKSKRRAWGVPEETDATRGVDNAGLLTAQASVIKQQDEQLDLLGQSIARTKAVAIAIDEEVTDQDKLLQGLSDHVDSTGARLRNTTRRVERTEKSASTKCLWAVICVLFLGLIATVVLGNDQMIR
jgi:syntaxin 8